MFFGWAYMAGTGGAMMAPISVAASIFLIWPAWSGVSRTISTRRRRSFSVTSAAREISVVVTPVAISARVFTEQGATIMPMVRNEPLEIAAARSSGAWTLSAKDFTAASFLSVS